MTTKVIIKKILKGMLRDVIFWMFPKLKESRKTILEKYQEYAEKIVIESGINLENVLVHNYGQWGLAGKTWLSTRAYTIRETEEFGIIKIPIPNPEEPYIVVPEITGWWEFSAWIHEVGHYTNKHYCDMHKKSFIKEYEAEKFCLEKVKECGFVDDYDFIDFKYSSVEYLESHIDKAIVKGEIKYMEDIPEEVVTFLYQCNYMKEALPDKFVEIVNESIQKHRKFDRYYA